MIASANISSNIVVVQTSTANTAGTIRETALDSGQPAYSFANGTGANQAAYMFSAEETISSPLTFDLTSLTSSVGTIGFSNVRFFYIENQATVDGYTLTVGGAGTDPWVGYMSGTETVGPSGSTQRTSPLATGFPVTSTSKMLQLDPGSNPITFRMVILGS